MGKHFTLDERITISSMLDSRHSFRSIALSLSRDPSTISREVRFRRVFRKTGSQGHAYNACRLRFHCDRRSLCSPCSRSGSRTFCWSCRLCNEHCPDFKQEHCRLLLSPPYVCNGCPSLPKCSLEKAFYQPAAAHQDYLDTLSETRQGISLSSEELQRIDAILSPAVRKGQSIHHIWLHNKDSLMVSETTLYRLISYNLFSVRNIDLPRKVRLSARKAPKPFKIEPSCRMGRSYADFQNFLALNPDTPVVEMDSVLGTKGGKALLTLHFIKSGFMLAFLRDSNDAQSVLDIFERLYLELRPDRFMDLFPVLLTDNGSEFSHPSAIELDGQGNPRTRVFYCDPGHPEQKGAAERNHELIRYCIPKGTSLDDFSQPEISFMMDNINSLSRRSLGDKCPFEAFSFFHGQKIPGLLGCRRIPPNDIVLTPALFHMPDAQRGGDFL